MKLRVKKFMKDIGFKSVDEVIYGIHDGFLASITDEDGFTSLFVDFVLSSASSEEGEKIRNIIRLNSKQYSILRAEVNETGALVVFASTISSFNKLQDFFYFFLQQLKLAEIKGASVCTNCGNPITSLKIVSLYNRLHTCDPACASQLVSSIDIKQKKESKNFILGFIGALFGAAVGVVPFIVLSKLDFFVLWSGIFIGLFSKGGYELLGGKKCIAKTIFLPILSFAVTIPALYYTYCFKLSELWLGRNYIVEFQDVYSTIYELLLEKGSLQTTFITESLTIFGFAILGLLLVMRFPKKTHSEKVFIV